ncbi:MAG: DNA polymerase III subunit delta [Chloroflexi bacterium]|nr:DNA polymerase III subunit delta [Chloroflexota bacterium]
MTSTSAKTELKPIYLIVGDEPALINLEIAKIKKRVGKAALEFNFDQFSAYQASAEEVIACTNTSPFMADRRLVLFRNVEKLPKEDIVRLASYAANPAGSACLVLLADSLNDRSPLYKAANQSGDVILRKVEMGKIPAMIKKGFEKRGQVVSDAVVKHLVGAVGGDITRLGHEVEKISLYCLDQKVISLDDIRLLVVRSDETRIFELTDRIGMRDLPGAVRVLEQLLQSGFEKKNKPASSGEGGRARRRTSGEAPVEYRMVSTEEHVRWMFRLLVNHFRALLRAKALLEAGAGDAEIAERLGVKGPDRTRAFLVGKYRRQCDNFALGELRDFVNLFMKTDLALKSTGQPPEGLLERLVVALASR